MRPTIRRTLLLAAFWVAGCAHGSSRSSFVDPVPAFSELVLADGTHRSVSVRYSVDGRCTRTERITREWGSTAMAMTTFERRRCGALELRVASLRDTHTGEWIRWVWSDEDRDGEGVSELGSSIVRFSSQTSKNKP